MDIYRTTAAGRWFVFFLNPSNFHVNFVSPNAKISAYLKKFQIFHNGIFFAVPIIQSTD